VQDVGVGSHADGTAAWYARAAAELAETSELQVGWARGIAADPEVLALIDELPREHRQPSLIFSAMRLLDVAARPWDEVRSTVIARWPRIAAVARARRTQTNEVGRCAPLLAALDRIAGPVALLELGASAGLCLGVDRYSYRFDDEPALGRGEPLLRCATSGAGRAPRRMPEVVWRAGIDLAPLDVRDPDDAAWLAALLPPDRPERLARLRAASATMAGDPPTLVPGDAAETLPALAATARAEAPDATLVVAALGTLVYLDPAARSAVPGLCRDLGARIITLEPLAALPAVRERLAGYTAPHPTAFVLALDEEPVAFTSAHGDRLSWLSPVRQPGAGEPAA
jgi:hypothetical protein